MQAIADHKGKFLDIFVGYPGSVHDARVLKNSTCSPVSLDRILYRLASTLSMLVHATLWREPLGC